LQTQSPRPSTGLTRVPGVVSPMSPWLCRPISGLGVIFRSKDVEALAAITPSGRTQRAATGACSAERT
jgi:hypothetical protein